MMKKDKSSLVIPETIKRSRLRKGWTQKKLAEEVKVSGVYISKLEQGVNLPGDELALKLARKLDLDEKDFVSHLFRDRASEDIKFYLPVPNEPFQTEVREDIRELVEAYETLDGSGKEKIRMLLCQMADYVNRLKRSYER